MMQIQEGDRPLSVLDCLRHPGWPRHALFGLGLLLALTIVIRLVLDPIAAHFTHKQLNASEAVSGDFESVHVTLLPPGYGIRRLKIIEAQVGDWRHPHLPNVAYKPPFESFTSSKCCVVGLRPPVVVYVSRAEPKAELAFT